MEVSTRRTRSNTQLTSLLAPFSSVDRRCPDNARVDHSIEQREAKGNLTVSGIASFLVGGVWTIGSAFVSHTILGPPRKSWGIEMSVFTTFLRNTANYSHLSSITRLRHILSLGQLFPIRDGIVTPLTFPVRQRTLRGFLAEADRLENGSRQLTGEWVVHRKLWLSMQKDYRSRSSFDHYDDNDGPDDDDSEPQEKNGVSSQSTSSDPPPQKIILFLHGGAYYVMSSATHRYLTIAMSKYTNTRIFAVNYRLAPETRFPGQLHDAVSAYFRLIIDLEIDPENIIFAGDSAGGGLCAATLLYLRDEGYPLPSGAILMSPWVDLTMSCASWDDNAPFDYIPHPKADDHLHPVKCLLGSPKNVQDYITHPYASPLFGDFTGLPPLLIQNGDAELLRDEGILLAHKASLAGVNVSHEVYADCPHVFQAFLFLDASRQALQSCRQFSKNIALMQANNNNLDINNNDYNNIHITHNSVDQEILSHAHGVNEDTSLHVLQQSTTTTTKTNGHHYQANETLHQSQEESIQVDETMFTSTTTTTRRKRTSSTRLRLYPFTPIDNSQSHTNNQPQPSSPRRLRRSMTTESGNFHHHLQKEQYRTHSHHRHVRQRSESSISSETFKLRRQKQQYYINPIKLSSPITVRARSSSHPELNELLSTCQNVYSPNTERFTNGNGCATSLPATPNNSTPKTATEDYFTSISAPNSIRKSKGIDNQREPSSGLSSFLQSFKSTPPKINITNDTAVGSFSPPINATMYNESDEDSNDQFLEFAE